MEIIAHRGACFDAPENSIEAFDIAVAEGADRIELDVQLSADGHVVVCHDARTGRISDLDLPIDFSTRAELDDVRLANGERLPCFDEVCARLRGKILLDVEIKSTRAEVADEVLRILQRHRMEEETLITSFDASTLRKLRLAGFDGKTGLLVGSQSLSLRQRRFEAWPLHEMEQCGAQALVIHHWLPHLPLRKALRNRGLELYLWTAVDDERKDEATRARMYERLHALNPDGIIVGRIEETKQVLASLPLAPEERPNLLSRLMQRNE